MAVPAPDIAYLPPTFAGCPRGTLADLRPGLVVVAGLAADSLDARRGSAEGPAAVRAAVARFVSQVATSPSRSATDPATGRTLRIPSDNWQAIDLGDIEYAAEEVAGLSHSGKEVSVPGLEAGAIPLLIGGDSSITTVASAVLPEDFGFLHVTRSLAGAEDPDSSIPEVALGLSGQEPERFYEMVNRERCLLVTAAEIARDGIDAATRRALEHLSGCRRLLLSVDMGAVDAGYAAGTPEIGIGGLTPRDLLAFAREVSVSMPPAFIIVDGIAPGLDGRRRTEALAARVAIELIAPRVFA